MQKSELIERLNSGKEKLSFTSLKEFSKSPASFISYKLREIKEETPAMKIGSAFHCIILEPEMFKRQYCVLLKSNLPFPDLDFRNSENKKYKDEFYKISEDEGKIILSEDEYNECLLYQKLCMSNQITKRYISICNTFESHQEFEYNGLKFHGYIDAFGSGTIIDLKKVQDASPSKISRSALFDRWHLQGALYLLSPIADEFAQFYNLCVDKVSPAIYELSESSKQIAYAQLKTLTDEFKRCTDEQSWDCGYEFYSNNLRGIFTI